jgi:hypothetical protein
MGVGHEHCPDAKNGKSQAGLGSSPCLYGSTPNISSRFFLSLQFILSLLLLALGNVTDMGNTESYGNQLQLWGENKTSLHISHWHGTSRKEMPCT